MKRSTSLSEPLSARFKSEDFELLNETAESLHISPRALLREIVEEWAEGMRAKVYTVSEDASDCGFDDYEGLGAWDAGPDDENYYYCADP